MQDAIPTLVLIGVTYIAILLTIMVVAVVIVALDVKKSLHRLNLVIADARSVSSLVNSSLHDIHGFGDVVRFGGNLLRLFTRRRKENHNGRE